MRPALAFVLAAVAMACLPAGAAAAYDPVASGSTMIQLDPSFRAALRENGVKLEARAGAHLRGARVVFPVSGGRLDPVAAAGTVEHSGALVFRAGRRRLPMKSLQLKTTEARSPLAAKFGGGKLRLAQSSRLATGRSGFGFAATVTVIRLSAKVAERLDKKLRLRGVFKAGEPVGRARTVAQPVTIAILPQGQTTLELSPRFVAKLHELFVAVNPIFPAEHPGTFTFPITGREIAPDGLSGTVRTAGSLELLQLGGGQIFWAEPYVDLGVHQLSAEVDIEPIPKFPGKLGRVGLFDATTGTVTSDPKTRSVAVTGIALRLQAPTAEALNQSFAEGKIVFETGEAVGTLGFTAQTQ